MILYMYIAPGQGLTTPWGRNFYVNRNVLSLRSFVASVKKSLWRLILYNFFIILYMYIVPEQGQTAPGDKVLMSTKTSCHFIHLLQVSKKSLQSLILYNCFIYLIRVYSPRAGLDSPQGTKFWCQQKRHVTSFICYKFQKQCLWSLILYNLFHDLIHVYSPGAGTDSPQGTTFWCQQKGLITLPICCKFQKNLFEVWFYTIL